MRLRVFGREGKQVVVVEAKKTSNNAAAGGEQAKAVLPPHSADETPNSRSTFSPTATTFCFRAWNTIRSGRGMDSRRATNDFKTSVS